MVNFVKYFVSTVYKGIVWFLNLFIAGNDIAIETSGHDFNLQLNQRLRELNLSGLFNINFFDRAFHELCQLSRRDKKPILIAMIRD